MAEPVPVPRRPGALARPAWNRARRRARGLLLVAALAGGYGLPAPAYAQADAGRELAEQMAAMQARLLAEDAQRSLIGPFEPRDELERDILAAAQLDLEFGRLGPASVAGDAAARARRQQIVDRLDAFDEQYAHLATPGVARFFRLQWMVLSGQMDSTSPENLLPSIRVLYQARYAGRDARNAAEATAFFAAQETAAARTQAEDRAVATGPPPRGGAGAPAAAPAAAAAQAAPLPAAEAPPPEEPEDESLRAVLSRWLFFAFMGLFTLGLVYVAVEKRVRPAGGRAAPDPATLPSRLSAAPGLRRITEARTRVANTTDLLERADAALAEAVRRAGQAIGEGLRQIGVMEEHQRAYRTGPDAQAVVAGIEALPVHLAASFTADRHVAVSRDQHGRWQDWTPPAQPMGLTQSDQPGFLLRWGSYDPAARDPLAFSALPLIGGGKPWVIVSETGAEEDAHALMCALALRIACTLPKQARFTFLDPLGYGQAFPLQRDLPWVRKVGGDLAQDLQSLQGDVRRIIHDVVAFHGSFDALPAEQQAAERYEFIFAADFPKAKAYDRRVTEMLFDIGRAGPKAGRYLILHMVEGSSLPHGVSLDDLGDGYRIDLTGASRVAADRPPSPALQRALLDRVKESKDVQRSAGLDDILPARTAWWTGSAARAIGTTLDGQKDGLEIAFGPHDGTELVHGVLAAQAGAGKSNLLHVLILGLATRYAPEELQLYLLDLKQGVEFVAYADQRLPHAAVVAYNSAPALVRAVLVELRQEMKRRYDVLFKQAHVDKLEDYRAAGEPYGPAPRVLLVIDEYQALFQGGDAQAVSADLLAISTQGRAAGVHMLLGSQTFRAVGMQNSGAIFDNINVRIAMQIPAGTVQTLEEFRREGKEMIAQLSSSGQVVVNLGAGRDGANKRGQVALAARDERLRVLAELRALADSWPADRRARWPRTQVFDGNRAPDASAQPLAEAARAAGAPLDVQALARWAASPKSAGGLGRTDWRPSDAPVPLVLGREYAVHGYAACVLRRLPNQNLLLVGSSMGARLGMLKGLVTSVLGLAPDVLGTVRAIDFSGDPAIGAVLAAGGVRIEVLTGAGGTIDAIDAAPAAGADLLLLVEPDRAIDLMRPTDPLARAPGPDALERRLREGPLAGRHTIVVVSGVSGLGRVLGRRGASAFAWRAVTQMSQDDSQDLLGNRSASLLAQEGLTGPEAALLEDVDGRLSARFMPFAE